MNLLKRIYRFTNLQNISFVNLIKGIKKLSHMLPRKSLLTIYKAFLRLYIDCRDITFNQRFNEFFCNKLKPV